MICIDGWMSLGRCWEVNIGCIDIIPSLRHERQESSLESMQITHVWIILDLIIQSCLIDRRGSYSDHGEVCMREYAQVAAHRWFGEGHSARASCIEDAQTSKADVDGKIGVTKVSLFCNVQSLFLRR